MTIYLMQRTDDATRVDEIEGKLKSTIPDLKRVPSLEDIDEISINGVERSIVVLVAAAPESPGCEILAAPPTCRCLPPVPDSAVSGWQKEPL